MELACVLKPQVLNLVPHMPTWDQFCLWPGNLEISIRLMGSGGDKSWPPLKSCQLPRSFLSEPLIFLSMRDRKEGF
jgi:hypothetical protein